MQRDVVDDAKDGVKDTNKAIGDTLGDWKSSVDNLFKDGVPVSTINLKRYDLGHIKKNYIFVKSSTN